MSVKMSNPSGVTVPGGNILRQRLYRVAQTCSLFRGKARKTSMGKLSVLGI